MLDESFRGTGVVVVETFDNNCHVFSLISTNNNYYLQYENNPMLIKKLIIKPDLWVFYMEGGYDQGIKLIKPLNQIENKVSAMNFMIDPDIFELLINKGLISYSKAMADLYNFDEVYSSDYKYHKRDYKNSKNKEKVLEKMRQGVFN